MAAPTTDAPSVHARLAEIALLEPVEAAHAFYHTLAPLLRSDGGFFALSGRVRPPDGDPMRGWRAVLTDRYDPAGNWDSMELDELHAEIEEAHIHDPPTHKFVAGPYVTRVRDRRDVIPDRESDDTPSGVHLRKLGFSERIVVATPVTQRAEIFVGFDRKEGSPRYTDGDRALLRDAIPALVRHGRSLALMFGLVGADGMLTLRERQVLHHLLRGASEAEAAFEIGMSKRNCHQRVVRIYRQLGVSSRGELLGWWLSGAERFGVPPNLDSE